MHCTITKIDSSKIFFTLTRDGNTLATEIKKTEVQDVRFGLNNTNAPLNQDYTKPDSTQSNNNDDESSKLEKLEKYRNILIDNIVAGNKGKANEIIGKAYKNISDKNYVVLYPNEKFLLSFWERDYKQISQDLMNLDSIESANTEKIHPNPDQLYKVLLQTITNSTVELRIDITNASNLSDDEKSFLLIILDAQCYDNIKNDFQQHFNGETTQFIKKYPSSSYNTVLRHTFDTEFTPKGFSWGLEFYTGSSFIGSKTSDYFSNGGLFGMGFVWGYGNFNLYTRFASSSSILRKNPSPASIWQRDSSVSVELYQISVGYTFRPLKRVSITPIVGLGWFSASPNDNQKMNHRQIRNIEIKSNGQAIAGLELGWDFTRRSYFNPLLNKTMYYYSCIYIRYEMQPLVFSSTNSAMNGYVQNIILSYKFGFGGAKKIY
jgi:hypothetical protein